MSEKLDILKSKISAVKKNKISHLFKNKNYNISDYICVSNTHTVILGYKDRELRKATNNSWISFADGKPLSILGNLLYGKNTFDRITGPYLMKYLIGKSEDLDLTHFFYGGTKNTIKKLKNKLSGKKDYVEGYYSPPFRDLSETEIKNHFNMINKSRANIIWIALGAPKQEKFMYRNLEYLDRGVMIGVGAAFDYYVGNIKRAPVWMQKCSLEWLYRILQEPRRLGKRYAYTNTLFILLAIKELYKRKIP